ncbi:tyrosine-protein phosphatase non-receptor type 22 [Nematolebias whitei]|uniref:tyrosine-protein phosphatase non-receptor type 22 n=1 Tax=Nematolebias whitei TaxID=451745 RepID=UPI00189B7C82|nr:tyrosine-protein phosphatase non-receptor type 22 [Nematolebias whitei]
MKGNLIPGSTQPTMEQQAWILRSILPQLESQEAAGEEAPNGIAGEFAKLKTQSTKYRIDKTFSTKTAEKQENIKKNRYKDIVPFDHTRVKLTLRSSKIDTDYINASFIKGVSGSKAYIATQGPLPHTVVDFLRMLWEYDVQIIVMSCREFEMGKKKCEVYWPQTKDEAFVCEPFTVHCDSEEDKGEYLTRTLRLTYHKLSHTLKQLHYVNWPDHGVPDTIPPILDMLHEMRCYQPHDDVPICIHCSAGCGRTGALIVIDYTWNLLRKHMISLNFNIYNLVQDMRTQRPSVVQTKEQYLLVYRTVTGLFHRYLRSMEPQNSPQEGSAVPSAVAEMTEDDFSDHSEEFHFTTEHLHLLDEKSDVFLHYHAPLASALGNLEDFDAVDMLCGQQQYQPFQTLSDASKNLNEKPNNLLLQSIQTASAEDSSDFPLLDTVSLLPAPEAFCQMVEDPYFEEVLSSPSSEEAPTEEVKWIHSPVFSAPSLFLDDQIMRPSSPASVLTDDEVPPPLPERTPESFVLAVDPELSGLCDQLSVISPPSTAADDGEEQEGSFNSHTPPLPERTPESFELAVEPVPVEKQREILTEVPFNGIGIFSEWSGSSTPEVTFQKEKGFVRNQTVRAEMISSAPSVQTDPASAPSSTVQTFSAALDQHNPPQLPQTVDHPALSTSDGTPGPVTLPTENIHSRSPPRPSSIGWTLSPRVGMSSEWDGTTQPRKFLDVVKKRSKSVRAKGSKQEPLTSFQTLTPLPVVAAQGGSAQQVQQHDVNRRPSLNTDRSGNKVDQSNEKGMSRAKSLKLFRHKQRPKTAPPPPPAQPGPTPLSVSTPSFAFEFGFKNRFGKPKGPRTYPETWK